LQEAFSEVVSEALSDYTPQAGDVVEFEYEGKTCRGLVFMYGDSEGIASLWGRSNGCTYSRNTAFDIAMITIRKVGNTDLVTYRTGRGSIIGIAETYFAQPRERHAFSPQGTYAQRQQQAVKHYGWKVGDKVKVVREYEESGTWSNWECGHKEHVKNGKVGKITNISDGYIDIDNWTCPYFVLEPVKK
jgi:hypothetical protein